MKKYEFYFKRDCIKTCKIEDLDLTLCIGDKIRIDSSNYVIVDSIINFNTNTIEFKLAEI